MDQEDVASRLEVPNCTIDFGLRFSGLALVVLMALSVSGCGFLLVNGPPERHEEMNYFSCTESNAGPILDAIWAGLNLAGTVAIAVDPDEYESNFDYSSSTGIAVGVGWTLVSGNAAGTGFKKTSDCRKAKRALADRQMQGQARDTTPSVEDESQD